MGVPGWLLSVDDESLDDLKAEESSLFERSGEGLSESRECLDWRNWLLAESDDEVSLLPGGFSIFGTAQFRDEGFASLKLLLVPGV
jgi:hypothetical protein